MVNLPTQQTLIDLGINSYERGLLFSVLGIRAILASSNQDELINKARMQVAIAEPYSTVRVNLFLESVSTLAFRDALNLADYIPEIYGGTLTDFSAVSTEKLGFLDMTEKPMTVTTLERYAYWCAEQLKLNNANYDNTEVIKFTYTLTGAVPTLLIDATLPFDTTEYLETDNLIQALLPVAQEPPSGDPLDVAVNFLGEWNSTSTYQIKDAVQYMGSAWIAKTVNTNKRPDSNPSDWNLWVAGGEIPKIQATGLTYYVSSVIGSDSNDGLTQQTPFRTIAKAIEQLEKYWIFDNSNTRIYLQGTFNESFDLYNLTFRGQNPYSGDYFHNLVFDAWGSDSANAYTINTRDYYAEQTYFVRLPKDGSAGLTFQRGIFNITNCPSLQFEAYPRTIFFQYCTFNYNETNYYDALLYFNNCPCNFYDCTFNENTGNAWQGISLENGAIATIQGCTFNNWYIAINSLRATAIIRYCTFNNCGSNVDTEDSKIIFVDNNNDARGIRLRDDQEPILVNQWQFTVSKVNWNNYDLIATRDFCFRLEYGGCVSIELPYGSIWGAIELDAYGEDPTLDKTNITGGFQFRFKPDTYSQINNQNGEIGHGFHWWSWGNPLNTQFWGFAPVGSPYTWDFWNGTGTGAGNVNWAAYCLTSDPKQRYIMVYNRQGFPVRFGLKVKAYL